MVVKLRALYSLDDIPACTAPLAHFHGFRDSALASAGDMQALTWVAKRCRFAVVASSSALPTSLCRMAHDLAVGALAQQAHAAIYGALQ